MQRELFANHNLRLRKIYNPKYNILLIALGHTCEIQVGQSREFDEITNKIATKVAVRPSLRHVVSIFDAKYDAFNIHRSLI